MVGGHGARRLASFDLREDPGHEGSEVGVARARTTGSDMRWLRMDPAQPPLFGESFDLLEGMAYAADLIRSKRRQRCSPGSVSCRSCSAASSGAAWGLIRLDL